jgi:hypothetical protein
MTVGGPADDIDELMRCGAVVDEVHEPYEQYCGLREDWSGDTALNCIVLLRCVCMTGHHLSDQQQHRD